MLLPKLGRSSTTVCTADRSKEELMGRSVSKMDWLSTARLTLQLSEEERRRAACIGKLQYLQARLDAFEQRAQLHQQHQKQSQHPTSAQSPTSLSSQSSQPPPPQPELLRSATAMRLTPSTHLLAQQERDRDIQQRRRRRAGRQLPATMNGTPLIGRSLQGSASSADEAPRQPAVQTPQSPRLLQPPPQPPPPSASTPHPPPLPESVTSSAGFYKLGFGPGERGAATRPLDGRLDGQRASLQRQRHRRGGDSSASSYLDGQAKRFLRVTASSGLQTQQQKGAAPTPDSIAVRVAMRDYERTFLQPRNPVNSPEPEAYQQQSHF